MTRFHITILGSGSAMPTTMHNPPSQLVDLNEKLFLVDCGEGTQLQMRKYKARIGRLHSIFISHLHGDHIFGLPGLLTTLSMMGRTGDINLFAHKDIEQLLKPLFSYMGNNLSYKLNLIPLNPLNSEVIFENKSIKITSFPLNHRIDTNGFIFEQKESPLHIKREMIDFHQIPFKFIHDIKHGANYITSDGTVVKNELLTYRGSPAKKYAYCSDTAYFPEIVPYIKNANILYHEATFAESELIRAKETYHSTAQQAAKIAAEAEVEQLVIGHFSSRYKELEPLLNEAQAVFPKTELASEGKIYQL